MKTLFEYTIIKQEKHNKNGETTDPAEILLPITAVLAKDVKEVEVLAARAIPEEEVANLDRITIAVRPF